MGGHVEAVGDDGRVSKVVAGKLRIGIGSALQIGTDVELSVVSGNLVISGPVPGADPAQAGAIWIDASGFLRVSAG